MRTFFGRQRHNVLEALDWVTKEIVAVTNDACVNAATFVELLLNGSNAYEGREVPMALDNADVPEVQAGEGKDEEARHRTAVSTSLFSKSDQ